MKNFNIVTIPILFMAVIFSGCGKEIKNLGKLRCNNLDSDLYCLYTDPELPDHPLNYDEIIDIALCRNLDLFVQAQQSAIAREAVCGERLKMIPRLLLNGDFTSRNNTYGSASKSLVPNIPPAPPSTSTSRDIFEWDFTLSWNLLDFGLTYIRQRQENNKFLKQRLEYERVRQKLILDVTQKFWRAVAAKKAVDTSKEIYEKLNKQKILYQDLASKHIIPERDALESENDLVNTKIQLQSFELEYEQAKYELGGLLGLPPVYEFELAQVEPEHAEITIAPIDDLEYLALTHRPEIYSQDVDEQIAMDDVRYAVLQYLPGIEPFVGPNYNSNHFLTNKHWTVAGFRASWNLLSLPQHFHEKRVGQMQTMLVRQTRLAISAAILTQVNIAFRLYEDAKVKYDLSKELLEIKTRILKTARVERKAGNLNDADLLKFEAEELIAEVNMLKQYGDLRTALEQLNNGIGMPLYLQSEVKDRIGDEEGEEQCTG